MFLQFMGFGFCTLLALGLFVSIAYGIMSFINVRDEVEEHDQRLVSHRTYLDDLNYRISLLERATAKGKGHK